MQELLKKSTINLQKVSDIVRRVSGRYLSELSEPCYYPEHRVYYYELLNACNLTDQDVKEWVKNYWKGLPQEKWKLQNDPGIMFTIFLMYVFLKEKDVLSFESSMVYYVGRLYSNAMHHFIPYCNPDVFKYTLETLTKTHLFYREKTISGALYHLSKELSKKYIDSIKNNDKNGISRFIQESRGRVSQSCMSFRDSYYENAESGRKFSTTLEVPGEEQPEQTLVENLERISTEIARRITVFGEKHNEIFEKSKKFTRVSPALSEEIAKHVSIPEFRDDVKNVVFLFLQNVTKVSELCGPKFLVLVSKLLSLRRTTKEVYFKKEVTNLLVKVLRRAKLEKKFLSLTRQTQFNVVSFLALYITLFAKDTLCGGI